MLLAFIEGLERVDTTVINANKLSIIRRSKRPDEFFNSSFLSTTHFSSGNRVLKSYTMLLLKIYQI